MKIVNPLSPKKTKEHISSVLYALAGQGGCDGTPYDQMQMAADYILELEAKIKLSTEILKDLVTVLSPYLEDENQQMIKAAKSLGIKTKRSSKWE